jgi:hypothetical protein
MESMSYQCCFCALSIETPAHDGVSITLSAMRTDGPMQDMFAHIRCLDDRFAPLLSAETPFDAGAFEPD